MPIHDGDWCWQYFDGVPCPDDVDIPTADGDAWRWNPRHRWVYNKLAVAESQGLECAPFGVVPPAFPVFSKPMMNLHGMGAGSAVLRSEADYDRLCKPGHMWMPLLEGEHVSSDVAVENGRPVWWRHATGLPAGRGMFDYWTIHAEPFPEVEGYCGDWIERHLAGYSGMVNLETIGARIIELHLRFADQWPDLYGGRPWVEAIVGLYAGQGWRFAEGERRTGYSVPLFGPSGRRFRHPPAELQGEVRATADVSSLQITFHEDRPPEWASNPPGGFRLAIVNCFDLEVGKLARGRLAEAFHLARGLNDTDSGAEVAPIRR